MEPKPRRGPTPVLALVALLVGTAPALAADSVDDDAAPPESPESLNELRDSIERTLEEENVPAAGIAVVDNGKVAFAEAFGVADRENDRKATNRTRFRLGSISKTFVALAAMKLTERGTLDLDAPVKSVAPDLPFQNPHADEHPVRLVHLLEHTAGFEDLGLAAFAKDIPGIDLDRALGQTKGAAHSRWTPGRYFAYSNVGPTMVAQIVSMKAGRPFDDVTQSELFEPLGMETATWQPSSKELQNTATGYRADGTTRVPYKHIVVWPSGSLSMNPTDMGTFLELMVNRGRSGGTRILERSSIERTESPETTLAARDGLETGYGLGNATRGKSGYLLRGHDGGMAGHLATYRYIPNEAGFAVSINSSDGEALDALRSTLRKYVTRDVEKPEPEPTANLDVSQLARRTGYFQPMALRQDWARVLAEPQRVVRITRDGDELRLSPLLGSETTRLIPTGPQSFRTPESPKATTFFTKTGTVHRNIDMGTVNYRRVPAVVAWGRLLGLAGAILLMISSVVFSIVWLPRVAIGSLDGSQVSLRSGPAVASWCFVAMLAALVGATTSNPIETLGTVNTWSVGIGLTSVLFLLSSIGAVVRTGYREWVDAPSFDAWGPWIARWHTRLVAGGLLFFSFFLGAYGFFFGVWTWTL